MQVLVLVVLIWVCLSHPAIRPFVHFLVHFLLLLTIETLDVNDNDIQMCPVNASTSISCFDVGVSFSFSNKTTCSFFSALSYC